MNTVGKIDVPALDRRSTSMKTEMIRIGTWHENRPSKWRNLPKYQALSGYAVGVLCIPGVAALLPGNIQNASTFQFPVLYKILRDVSFEQIAKGDSSATAAILAGAQELVDGGARAVVGACGSLGHYQTAVANAVSVPVFMSILTQVPFLLRSLGAKQKLAVVFATTEAFTPQVRGECGIDDIERIVPIGLQGCSTLRDFTSPGLVCDGDAIFQEIVSRIKCEIDESVAALLLQCSDLPPFAAELQQVFGLPVFDMSGLINWLQAGLVRRDFQGCL